MKHLKTFEGSWDAYKTIDDNPKKGDYVLLRFPKSYGYSTDFFDNNIGQIIKRSGSDYIVKFEKKYDKYNYNISIVGTDIREYSKNKEDLEHFIQSNKYNL